MSTIGGQNRQNIVKSPPYKDINGVKMWVLKTLKKEEERCMNGIQFIILS